MLTSISIDLYCCLISRKDELFDGETKVFVPFSQSCSLREVVFQKKISFMALDFGTLAASKIKQ